MPTQTPEIPEAIAAYIKEVWQTLNYKSRPWGIWVSAHQVVAPDASSIGTPAYAAWFLDATGLQNRNIWDYARFNILHFDRPWCQRFGEPNGVFSRKWELGLARFAQLQKSNEFLVEIMLGGLLGEGHRVVINPDNTLQLLQKLWIS